MMISKSHEKFKEMKSLLKSSRQNDLTATDDLQVLEIALKYNLKINLLLYCKEDLYVDSTIKLLDDLIAKANESYEISKSSYTSLETKENHAGIVAAIEIPTSSLDDFKNKDFIVVLDRLEIPGNVGTIYRTLDSINCDGVIMVDSITKINNPKITSSSRGCNLIIPTLELSYEEAQSFLLDNNYDIYLGEPKLGKNYQEYNYDTKTAIVVGNERFGINPKWYDNKNKMVYIPMVGNQNSLNVSVAASIISYEVFMKKANKNGRK